MLLIYTDVTCEPSTAFSNWSCHYFTPLRSFYDLRSWFSSGHTSLRWTIASLTDCVTAKPTYKNINRPLFSLVLDLLKECQKLSLLGTFSGAASSSPLCQIKPGGIKALLNLLHKSVKPGLFFRAYFRRDKEKCWIWNENLNNKKGTGG